MIEIPAERLSAEVLRAVIEEFILREGTDYGSYEVSLEDKIDTCDADEMVDIAVNDIDLESRIIDAVQSEINAIDFKITVER